MLKEKIIFLASFFLFSLLLANKYTAGCLGKDLFENSFVYWNKILLRILQRNELLQRMFVHSRIGSILELTSQKFTLKRPVKEDWNSLVRKISIKKATKKFITTLDFHLKLRLAVKILTVSFGDQISNILTQSSPFDAHDCTYVTGRRWEICKGTSGIIWEKKKF